MERKKASDFPQEVLNLFDLYIHGDISRRDFMESATKVVGAISAVSMLEALTPNYAMAQQVAPDDKSIKGSWETFDSPNGTSKIKGYLVRPANASGKLPGVLVVHENRGLNPYVQDVVRRAAKAGFMAFGPDALSSLGGYPSNWPSYVVGKTVDANEVSTADQKATQMQASLDGKKLAEDWVNAAMWLKKRPDCTGRIGAVGFCYGGGVCNTLAVRLGPDLAAAAPYYGTQPSAEDAAKIKAARDTAQELGIHLFINARTDPFVLKFGPPDECLNEAARRAKVYADAGADGIFVPGLTDLALIERFVQLTPLPVNIMVTQGVPEIPDLARAGVRRVSLGPWPMMAALRVIGQAAAAVAASKQYGTFLQPNA